MKQLLQNPYCKKRFHHTLLLGLSIGFSVAMLVYRVHFSSTFTYAFLVWNIFLACIPFVISTCIVLLEKDLSKLGLFGLIVVWLLFFPNAPYIVTDLFHLDQRPKVPIWFDLMLIVSFLWNGLILTFLSLADVHQVVNRRYSKFTGWAFTLACIFLTGFGVYIGRYLRWNTWDVLTNPLTLATDLAHRVVYPGAHPKTWAFTVVFSTFLFLSYAMVRQMMMRARE